MALFGVFEIMLQANELSAAVGDVFDTQWGARWLGRNLLPVPALLFVVARFVGSMRRPVLAAAVAAAAGYLGITSSVRHSAAGAGAFWAVDSDFIHLVAASVWIGML